MLVGSAASYFVLIEGEAHVSHVFTVLALLLGDEGYAEVGPGHLFEILT